MKTCLLLMFVIALMLCATGCSVLVAPPPTAHVQIDGLNSQIGEFVVALNPIDEHQRDIRISDRYALRLDFKWLWDPQNDAYLYFQPDPDNMGTPLTPWMTCKYRF